MATYQLHDPFPDRWFTAGQPDLLDAISDEKLSEPDDLIVREDVLGWGYFDSFFGHAVEAYAHEVPRGQPLELGIVPRQAWNISRRTYIGDCTFQ